MMHAAGGGFAPDYTSSDAARQIAHADHARHRVPDDAALEHAHALNYLRAIAVGVVAVARALEEEYGLEH